MTDLDQPAQLEQEIAGLQRMFRARLADYRKLKGSPPAFLYPGGKPELDPALVRNARLMATRREILAEMAPAAVCIEIGVQAGNFSKWIFDTYSPREMHLADMSLAQMKVTYPPDVLGRTVHLHEGKSWEVMAGLADNYFDWVYIDAAHDYQSVRRDLEQACRIVKPGGYVICNDYTMWSVSEGTPYGVMPAVNEKVNELRWPVTHLALHHTGNFDIAFRRPAT